MAAKRLPVGQFREILRLRHECCLSQRSIARACSIGVGTVSEYLSRARRAGLRWPLPEKLDENGLTSRLFAQAGSGVASRQRPEFFRIHQELRRPGATRKLLWSRYLQSHPGGYRYSQFCDLYQQWLQKLPPSLRQVHRAGERVSVSYSAKKLFLRDRRQGQSRAVELFVGVFGASQYVYAEAVHTRDLASFIAAQQRMVEAFGGTPVIFVPNGIEFAASRSVGDKFVVARDYRNFAAHYGAAILPARLRDRNGAPKAEIPVLLAQRWILAALRNRAFFDLAELNAAIRDKLRDLNRRPIKKLGASRQDIFERLDRPALRPLPPNPFRTNTSKGVTSELSTKTALAATSGVIRLRSITVL